VGGLRSKSDAGQKHGTLSEKQIKKANMSGDMTQLVEHLPSKCETLEFKLQSHPKNNKINSA
jgi:hypothetical protein